MSNSSSDLHSSNENDINQNNHNNNQNIENNEINGEFTVNIELNESIHHHHHRPSESSSPSPSPSHPSKHSRSSTPKKGVVLEWSQLSWRVTWKKRSFPQFWHHEEEHKDIIKGVSGVAHPGELVALMGSSGAGKTSLMNLLAHRVHRGQMKGDIKADGKKLGRSKMKQILSYVTQDDIMIDTLTPREILKFCSRVGLPETISPEEKQERVERVIEDLGLSKCADTVVGTPGLKKGLSGGERKRVNIGMSLLSDPRILFLDEPTSGLDTSTALAIVKLLQVLSHQQGKTVISTIHQPNSRIFSLFDRVIVLAAGQEIYNGSLAQVVPYLNSMGFPCDSFANPADHIIELVNERDPIYNHELQKMQSKPERTDYLIEQWQSYHDRRHDFNNSKPSFDEGKKSEHKTQISMNEKNHDSIENDQSTDTNNNNNDNNNNNNNTKYVIQSNHYNNYHHQQKQQEQKNQYDIEEENSSQRKRKKPTSFRTQLLWLIWRGVKSTSRETLMTRTRVIQTIGMAVVGGILFWQLGNDQTSIRDRQGGLFFITMQQLLQSLVSVLFVFPKEQVVFLRESKEGLYGVLPYYLSKLITDIPIQVFFPVVFTTIVFFMMGLRITFLNYLYVALAIVLVSLSSSAVGFILSSVTGDLSQAMAIMPMFFAPQILFSGFFIAIDSIPIWLRWIRFFSFMRYGLNNIFLSEYDGLNLHCDDDEYVISPDGSRICPFTNGDQVLDQEFGLGSTELWEGYVALAVFVVGLRAIGYLALRISSWRKKRQS